MRMIETIIRQVEMSFMCATKDGKPCHRGNSYRADPVWVPEQQQLAVIECEPANMGDFPNAVRIDHHRPQDPGFNMGPENYWLGSSIGQLHRLLGLEPTHAARVMAAMDHCFPAAMDEQCPGINPSDVLDLKIEEISKATQVTRDYVAAEISAFTNYLLDAPEVIIGNQPVKLIRSHMGEGCSLSMLALQVAVAVGHQAVLVRLRDGPGEPDKIVLSGNVTSETIKVFLENWAPENGLERTYGVPSRGYAGGYVK
ncbi:MAG: hypothetical protein Q7R46_00065 [bacterium]|nr:hypothetical protein [bacterium]